MVRNTPGDCRICGAGTGDRCQCTVTAARALARALQAGPDACEECHGNGYCICCGGDGRVLVRPLGMSPTCPECLGSGHCAACHGTGRVMP